MRIKTHFPIEIEINNELFSIEVKSLNETEKNIFQAIAEDNLAIMRAYEADKREVEYLEDTINVNKALLATATLVDKAKLLWEQKTLLEDLKKAKEKLVASGDTPTNMESAAKKKFDLIVQGAQKEALAKRALDEGVSFVDLVDLLSEAYAKAKLGKSNS